MTVIEGRSYRRSLAVWALVAASALVFGSIVVFHETSVGGIQSPMTLHYQTSELLMHAALRHGDDPLETTESLALPATATPVRSFAEPSVELVPDSQGVILCLHDATVALGLSLIRELRCLGNDQVVEVYCCNSDLSEENQRLLREHDENIDVVDVCVELVERGVLDREIAREFERSSWLKALAVHQSQLVELIALDADVLLLQDPRSVRRTQRYVERGTTFFYERAVNASSARRDGSRACSSGGIARIVQTFAYARFGHELRPSEQLLQSLAYRGETCHEQDSSMLAIKKTQFGADKAMQLLWFLATEHRFAESFSWGDKEAFWLAYELAHVPYFFSPWGASVVSATANDDLGRHPDTLCGSLAQYEPVGSESDDGDSGALLYVNGKALVDQGYKLVPTLLTPRHRRGAVSGIASEQSSDCLTGLGSTPAPPALHTALWRRRVHFLSVAMGHFAPLTSCNPME